MEDIPPHYTPGGVGKMTDLEKQHISELREKGFSYQSIADETGISLGSIKMFFQRKKEPSATIPRCEQCSKPLRQDIVRIGRRFCSDICRVNWWTAHPRKQRDHSCTCPSCGKIFFSRKPRKFCSRACYYVSRRTNHVGL